MLQDGDPKVWDYQTRTPCKAWLAGMYGKIVDIPRVVVRLNVFVAALVLVERMNCFANDKVPRHNENFG
jgi:hypothetical protein